MKELYMVVLQFVTGLALTAGTKTTLYQYVQLQKTWLSAQRYCQHEFNGSLYNDQDSKTVNRIGDIPEHGQFWTGQYTTQSSWIASIGCYGQNGNSFPWTEHLSDNNAGLCQIHCNTSTYFALKGQGCVCLSNKLPRTFRKQYDTQCHIRCNSSNYFELCGGEMLYSVYERVQFVSDSTSTSDNCVAVKCHHHGGSSASLQYYGRDCTEAHRPVCQMRNGTNLIVLNEAHAANWTMGVEACYVENNTPIVTKMEMNCPYQFKPLFSDFFWVGIYRRKVTTFVKDDYLGNIQKCTAITKTSDSSRTYNCNTTLPFICQYVLEFYVSDISTQETTQTTPHTQSYGPTAELSKQSSKTTTHSKQLTTVIADTAIPELTHSYGPTIDLSKQSSKTTTHSKQLTTVIAETTIPELTQSNGPTAELAKQSSKAKTHSKQLTTVIAETTIPELTQSYGPTIELSKQSSKAKTHSKQLTTVIAETTIPELTQSNGPTIELPKQSSKPTIHSKQFTTIIKETTIPELTQSYEPTTELSKQSSKPTTHSKQLTTVITETTKSGTILNAITTNPQTTLDNTPTSTKPTQTRTETTNPEFTSLFVTDDQSSKSYFSTEIFTTSAGSTYDSGQETSSNAITTSHTNSISSTSESPIASTTKGIHVTAEKTARSKAIQTTFNLKTPAPTALPTSTKIAAPIGTFRTVLPKTTTALTETESPLISKQTGGVPIVPIAGGAGGVVVIIIIVAIFLIRRKKRSNYARSRDGPNLNDEKPPIQRDNPMYYISDQPTDEYHQMNGNSPIYAVPNKSGQRNSSLDNTYITPTHTEHRSSATTVTNPVFDSGKGHNLADDVADFSNPYNEVDEDNFNSNQRRDEVQPKPLTRYPEAYQGVSHA